MDEKNLIALLESAEAGSSGAGNKLANYLSRLTVDGIASLDPALIGMAQRIYQDRVVEFTRKTKELGAEYFERCKNSPEAFEYRVIEGEDVNDAASLLRSNPEFTAYTHPIAENASGVYTRALSLSELLPLLVYCRDHAKHVLTSNSERLFRKVSDEMPEEIASEFRRLGMIFTSPAGVIRNPEDRGKLKFIESIYGFISSEERLIDFISSVVQRSISMETYNALSGPEIDDSDLPQIVERENYRTDPRVLVLTNGNPDFLYEKVPKIQWELGAAPLATTAIILSTPDIIIGCLNDNKPGRLLALTAKPGYRP